MSEQRVFTMGRWLPVPHWPTVATALESWRFIVVHWDPDHHRMVSCTGQSCVYCQAGCRPRVKLIGRYPGENDEKFWVEIPSEYWHHVAGVGQ